MIMFFISKINSFLIHTIVGILYIEGQEYYRDLLTKYNILYKNIITS